MRDREIRVIEFLNSTLIREHRIRDLRMRTPNIPQPVLHLSDPRLLALHLKKSTSQRQSLSRTAAHLALHRVIARILAPTNEL